MTYCISKWYPSSTTADRRAVKCVVSSAQRIIGAQLPALEDIYRTWKATNICKDVTHPGHHLFLKRCHRAGVINPSMPRTTRFKNHLFLIELWLLSVKSDSYTINNIYCLHTVQHIKQRTTLLTILTDV